MIDWTPELEDDIAHRLINRSLRRICEEDSDIPSRESIRLHQVDSDDFWAKCARARKARCVQMLENADDAAEACTEDNAKAASVLISHAHWTAEKLLSKDYGAKLGLTGGDGGAIQIMSSIPRHSGTIE